MYIYIHIYTHIYAFTYNTYIYTNMYASGLRAGVLEHSNVVSVETASRPNPLSGAGKNCKIDTFHYGVATVSRIDKIIGLFCRIASLL